jgi:hypothetical protein
MKGGVERRVLRWRLENGMRGSYRGGDERIVCERSV